MRKYTEIGHTKSAHGLKGALKFFIEDQYFEDFSLAKKLYLETQGTKLPFFLESYQEGNELIVHLKGLTNRDQAFVLTSKKIFLSDKDILADEDRSISVEAAPFVELEGYMLLEKTKGEVGIIEEVREMPSQYMAIVEVNGRQIYVPLVDSFIVETNAKQKTLLMELPEGLLDL